MNKNQNPLFNSDAPVKRADKSVWGEYIILYDEVFYKIHNYDELEPFFMSIVSSSDHWLFISSTGGLSAGRISAEQSLFPYYTVDKVTENNENTGNKAILRVKRGNLSSIWEPLSDRCRNQYHIERNIYKNISSTMVIFEESNLDLGLTYRYAWRTSEKFGFVKTTWLINLCDSDCEIELLDGLQNILPTNIMMVTQLTLSSLLDAYKRGELDPRSGMAIFSLNSTLTDLPEPSESLMVTTVAQLGLKHANYLLSSIQLDRFRQGRGVVQEIEIRGRRGAYFVHTQLEFTPNAEYTWHLFADVNQDSAAIALKIKELRDDTIALWQDLEGDIATNQNSLWRIVARADGLQLTDNLSCTTHHFANVIFNVMRGGIFADQYWISVADFIEYISIHSASVFQENKDFFATLPAKIQVFELRSWADATGSTDLQRLCYSYLPLTFSRRHGDPSRPWNRFAINLKNTDGSLRLDYEGNWRDIFQNWEALAYSYPEFIENMICTFMNATTADGYNPYRITFQGVDWELPEPSDPWANIGYWSDHQIIYLQKLMEISASVHPGVLQNMLNRPIFSYSNVPYRIKPYAELLKDPYRTIIFDWDLERQIEEEVHKGGTDGKLIQTPNRQVLHVSLTEKLLTILLAKLANFVPEGGIWMNTQRPEWNDANNALVGKGLSIVTVCYLRRYVAFCKELLRKSALRSVSINIEVYRFYAKVSSILNHFLFLLGGTLHDKQRRDVMNALGEAGSEYRWNFYKIGFSGEKIQLEIPEIVTYLDLVQRYIDHTLRSNIRSDVLYHAYNILHLDNDHACISHLYEMLEGQVAILSSGLLSDEESLALLKSLRHSSLYQTDQNSYILYPDRVLPSLFERNCLAEDKVRALALFTELIDANDKTLIIRDINGVYHFNGQFRNVHDLNQALMVLQQDPKYADLVVAEATQISILFEETFHHDEFTGRSGTFFAYEGLGSIYWHMVSKLLLAVQETIIRFKDQPLANELINRYFEIRAGLGFNKTPAEFGAFPTDPYSHTPNGQGAKQPGMTGLVKEEILTRLSELGLHIQNGQIIFDPFLLDPKELLSEPSVFSWLDPADQSQSLVLAPGSLAFTFCQLPIIILASQVTQIEVFRADGRVEIIAGQVLDKDNTQHIFMRDGFLHHLSIYFKLKK
jgi:hypothetical protein